MSGGLSDIRILDLSTGVAGPFATRLMADLGADVVKIEQPGTGDSLRGRGPFPGDVPHPEASGMFLALNLNKRDITLDVSTAAGRRILGGLVSAVDAVVESFPPGLPDEWGIGYASLSAANPAVVVCSITPFGQTGPYRDRAWTELVVNALTPQMYGNGPPERAPHKPYGDTASFFAGAMAATSVLAAVWGARRDGVGEHIDLSMVECFGTTVAHSLAAMGYSYTGMEGYRMPAAGAGLIQGTYPTADGYFIPWLAHGYMDRIVNWLDQPSHPYPALRDPKWLDLSVQGDPAAREEFDAIFYDYLTSRSKLEVWEECHAAGFIGAPVFTPEDIVEDPVYNERDLFVDVEHPVMGRVKVRGRHGIFERSGFELRRSAPLLGEHNVDVYTELGLTREDLVSLREQGVI